jgi:cell division protein ZipA
LVLIASIYIWDRRNRRTQPSDRLNAGPVAAPPDQPRGSGREAASHVPELDSVVVHKRMTERPLSITSSEAALDTDDLPPMHAGSAPDASATQYDGTTMPTSAIEMPRDSQFTGMNTGTFIAESARRSSHAPPPHETESESTMAVAALAAAPVAPSRSPPPPKKPLSRKIVALRLSAGSERVEGGRLKLLLESAGLRHGKYNIYHRLHSDDTPLFSVASMVEPGTFDPYAMNGVQFPGVTIFAQLPNVIDGGDVFERMLVCARELEQGIGGLLQDERGMPLTEQRAQRLRDDVTDFMHLMGQS